jgi:hypothetical protein
MSSGPEVLVAREALHHFPLRFICEFLPRDFQQALGLPYRLAIVCVSKSEDAAYEIPASGDAAGRQNRQSIAHPSTHGPNSFRSIEVFSDQLPFLLR